MKMLFLRYNIHSDEENNTYAGAAYGSGIGQGR